MHTPDFELTCRLTSVVNIPVCYFYAFEDNLEEIMLDYSEVKKD